MPRQISAMFMGLCLGVATFGWALRAQDATFRTSVNTIPVYVTVKDGKGRPVKGLSAADFMLFEDGTPQTIGLFYEVDLGSSNPKRSGAVPSGGTSGDLAEGGGQANTDSEVRFILLYFDRTLDPSLNSNGFSRSVRAARELIESIDPNRDFVALAWMDRVTDFSSNRTRLLALLEEVHPRQQGVLAAADPERVLAGNLSGEAFDTGPAEIDNRLETTASFGADGRPSPGQAQRSFETLFGRNPGFGGFASAQHIFNQLFEAGSVEGYLRTVSLLRNVRGRKIVVSFGAGFSNPTGEELKLSLYDPKQLARLFNDAGFSIYTFNPSGVQAVTTGEGGGARDPITGRPLPTPRGTIPPSSRTVEVALENLYLATLAEETGGRRFVTNDLGKGVGEIFSDLSHYYVIAYSPSNQDLDGRYRSIRLETRNQKLQILHRKGYFATVDNAGELYERTLLTALVSPEQFADLKLELEARWVDSENLEVTAYFPFSQLQSGEDGGFRQTVAVFMGAFGGGLEALGTAEARFNLDFGADRLRELQGQNATATRTIKVKDSKRVKMVRAVVIIGQNFQVASASLARQ